jgi:hypothetical protein
MAIVSSMQHNEFSIGATFWCGGRRWRCTDIGTRVIIAIRLDRVEVGGSAPELRRTLGQDEAEAEGWFNGPPYAVAESVFDEYDIEGCSLEPDLETAKSRDDA